MQETGKPVVLVTGSSGLIGTKLVEELASTYVVVGLDRDPPAKEGTSVDWTQCDLTDDEDVRSALGKVRSRHGGRLASVVHLAAYYDFSGEPSPLYEQLTVEGTRRLLSTLRRDFQVGQFVFSSTLLVMKTAEGDRTITEDSQLEPLWDYPRSKVDAENVIREERGPIPAVILRIAGVYDDDCHSIPIAQQIRRIREKKLESFFFPGDQDHGQPFVHMDDLVSCIAAAIARREELGEVETFLVAEPELASYGEMQDRIGNLLHGRDWPTIRIPAPVAKAGAWVKDRLAGGEGGFIKPWMIDMADAHYPVSIDRARERLGWSPEHRLPDHLPVMIDRLVRDPARWYRENGLETDGDGG